MDETPASTMIAPTNIIAPGLQPIVDGEPPGEPRMPGDCGSTGASPSSKITENLVASSRSFRAP
jgi:hypothetical protein